MDLKNEWYVTNVWIISKSTYCMHDDNDFRENMSMQDGMAPLQIIKRRLSV
jgi:hypothetical protein